MKPSVILMGSKPGSIVALRLMIERGWNVQYVITTPDIKYEWIDDSSLTDEANRLGLPVMSQDELHDIQPVDFVISYMYRKLVKSHVIELAKRGALNFHAGPLPRFGGWAFYNIAILENAKEYGCTCHYMDDGFDTGPLLKVNTFPIDPIKHTAISLERLTQKEMIKLFIDFLDMAEADVPLPSTPQCPSKMRYLRKEEFMKLKEIPANSNDEIIDRYARAFWYPPYECAYLTTNSAKVEVIPQIAKDEYAKLVQINALCDLIDTAQKYKLNFPKNYQ